MAKLGEGFALSPNLKPETPGPNHARIALILDVFFAEAFAMNVVHTPHSLFGRPGVNVLEKSFFV